MSSTSRKVGFYSIIVKKPDGSLANQKTVLNKVVAYIISLPKADRKFDVESSKKFHVLDSSSINGDKNSLVFKSAKYYHRPPLIHKDTLAERDNPKTLQEGETEKTHIGLRYLSTETICVIEERKTGISANNFVVYLTRFINSMAQTNLLRNQYTLELALIPETDFLEELKKLSEVKIGNVFVTKQLLGSDHLNFSSRLSETQDSFVISIRAKRNQTIVSALTDIYNKFVASDEIIKKIRVYGLNENKNKVMLDTEVLRKVQYVISNLDAATGVVESDDFFLQLDPFLDSFED